MSTRHNTLDGLRQLCDRQQPGEEMSLNQISAACRCTPQAVGQLERRALTNLFLGLQRRGLFRDTQPIFPLPATS